MSASNSGGVLPRLATNLGAASDKLGKSAQRLSSGLRINDTSDDPVAVILASKYSNQSDLYTASARNISPTLDFLEAAENAVVAQREVVAKISEIATEASNTAVSSRRRQALDEEAQDLKTEFERITAETYNGESIFNPARPKTAQVGPELTSRVQFSLGSILTRVDFESFTVLTETDAVSAITVLENVFDSVEGERAIVESFYSNFSEAKSSAEKRADIYENAKEAILGISEQAANTDYSLNLDRAERAGKALTQGVRDYMRVLELFKVTESKDK